MIYEPSCEEERQYLEDYDPNKYAKPSVTVDFIVHIKGQGILLIKRKNYPYKNRWALPGGFLDVGKENTLQAALRELKEETSLDIPADNIKLEGVYSDPDRDPRDHVVSVVYSVELDTSYIGKVKPADDAVEAKFFAINRGPVYVGRDKILAFDHDTILANYINKNCKCRPSITDPIVRTKRRPNLDILYKNDPPITKE